MRHSRTIFRLVLAGLIIILIGIVAAFFVLNSRNGARPEALTAIESNAGVKVSNFPGQDWLIFSPTGTTPTAGLIVYPGGFVDPVAYALIARDIAALGYFVVIDPMPLNLAVLGVNSADDIIAAFPEISTWAIGGHSLGGAMAAEYAARNPETIDGLALWAAYPANDNDLSDTQLEVVSIYGDVDGVASITNILDSVQRLPADTIFIPIPGGNHTQFGRYGEGLQRGDNPATIERDDQQRIIVDSTAGMLSKLVSSN